MKRLVTILATAGASVAACRGKPEADSMAGMDVGGAAPTDAGQAERAPVQLTT